MKSNHKPLKMKEIWPLKHQDPFTFETSGPTYLVTLHHIPEDGILQACRYLSGGAYFSPFAHTIYSIRVT